MLPNAMPCESEQSALDLTGRGKHTGPWHIPELDINIFIHSLLDISQSQYGDMHASITAALRAKRLLAVETTAGWA
jgi:hypothetical protein